MKKTDLYKSIDSIKPDKELKANIIKAVEENDKVTVIKRPLFVPIMVGILVCVNIGMAAKLVIFNKSQVNMSELGARASLSSASGNYESSVLENSEENDKPGGTEIRTFSSCVEKFEADMNSGDWWTAVEEWTMPKSEEFSKVPYYATSDWSEDIADSDVIPGDDEYLYVRYVERFRYNNIYMLTNHEYVVAYDGDSVPENIVSITESNIESNVDYADIERSFSTLNQSITISQNMEKTANEKMEELDPDKTYENRNCGALCTMLMYPVANDYYNGEAVLCCYYSLEDNNNQNDSVYNTFFLNDKGMEVSYELKSDDDVEKYWKETVYRSRKVKVPDIIGMDVNDAKKLLENSGLKIGTQGYGYLTRGMDFSANQIMECKNHTAGELVEWGTAIDIMICPINAVPFVNGIPLRNAIDLLTEKGLSYKIEYFDYENGYVPDNYDERYVFSSYPAEGSPVNDEVTLMAASDVRCIGEELVGNVIFTDGKMDIYYGNKADSVIKDIEEPEKGIFDFVKASLDTTYMNMYAESEYYGSGYFRIESIVSESETIYAAAGLRCGMLCENGVLDYLESRDLTDMSFNACSYDDYDYKLSYKNVNDKNVYVYIKVFYEDNGAEKIEKLCVSCKEL